MKIDTLACDHRSGRFPMFRRRVIPAARVIALTLFFSSLPGWAAPPIGNFETTLGGNLSVWFPGNGARAAFCEDLASELDELEHCDFEIFVDGKGKVYGHLDLAGWDAGIHLALQGPLKGSQRGDARTGFARTRFSTRLAGEAQDGSATLGARARFRYTGEIAPGGAASGLWDLRICVKGAGCVGHQMASLMPPRTNGGWTLGLAIGDAGGGALDGSARAEFGDGGECIFAIRGRYDAKTETSSLDLSPSTPDCAGSWIQLGVGDLSGTRPVTPVALKYKLFGHTADAVLIPYPRRPIFVPTGSLPGGPPPNQELFTFICEGTLTITAGTDPATCAWSLPGSARTSSGASVMLLDTLAPLTILPPNHALEIQASR